MKVSKSDINFYLDIVLFIAMMGLIATGVILHLVLPHGSGQLTFLGLRRHGWGDIHFWIALLFTTLILVHLVLHWNWIKAKLVKKSSV